LSFLIRQCGSNPCGYWLGHFNCCKFSPALPLPFELKGVVFAFK
jgi:hypothetical protein